MNRIAAAAFIVLVCGVACSGLDVKTATYANMQDAKVAIDTGIMPPGLPSSSYELRAAYVPDSWQRWGIINFPHPGAEDLRRMLNPEEISLRGVRVDIPPRVEWWPVQLRKTLDDERVKATGVKAYHTQDGKMIVVVNWPQGRAYYWTLR